MNYNGEERRKENKDFNFDIIRKLDSIEANGKALEKEIFHLNERIEHNNTNTKAFKLIIDDDIQQLKIAIQGNESKGIVGLAQKVGTFSKELSEHVVQDKWAYGVMTSLMLGTFGVVSWAVFHK